MLFLRDVSPSSSLSTSSPFSWRLPIHYPLPVSCPSLIVSLRWIDKALRISRLKRKRLRPRLSSWARRAPFFLKTFSTSRRPHTFKVILRKPRSRDEVCIIVLCISRFRACFGWPSTCGFALWCECDVRWCRTPFGQTFATRQRF